MLKRHHDLSGIDPGALVMELKPLSAAQAKKANQIQNEMKSLEEELARLLNGVQATKKQQQKGDASAAQ